MKLDPITIFFIEMFGPMGRLWAQMARLYLQPLLILLGEYGEVFLFILQDRKMSEKLVELIEEEAEKSSRKKRK